MAAHHLGSGGLSADLRAIARRARTGTSEERAQIIDRLLGRVPIEAEELPLF